MTPAERIQRLREQTARAPSGPWRRDDAEYRAPQWSEDWSYLRVVRGEPNPISGWAEKVVSTDGAQVGTEHASTNYATTTHIARWDPQAAARALDLLTLVLDWHPERAHDFCLDAGLPCQERQRALALLDTIDPEGAHDA